MGLEYFGFGGYEMIAIIVFLILAVAVIVLGIVYGDGSQYAATGICAIAFVLVMAFIVTVVPLRLDDYQHAVKKYDDIMFKISWTENHQNEVTMDEGLKLYQDIKDMNEMIQRGKAKCQNAWSGVMISDKYLEMNEIEIPTWLLART